MTNTTSTKFPCQGGQANTGAIQEQSAVAPSFLVTQFHRAQARLKRNPLRRSAQRAVGPLFKPELAAVESKTNLERLHDYQRKVAALEAA